jgi:anti-sigma B factor antagonist
MQITHSDRVHVTVVTICGSVDSLTADALTEHLIGHVNDGRIRLVADFSSVEYTSSAGLRSLLIAVKGSRKLGGDFRIAALHPNVERVLVLSGFTSILKIFADVDSAVASFGSA